MKPTRPASQPRAGLWKSLKHKRALQVLGGVLLLAGAGQLVRAQSGPTFIVNSSGDAGDDSATDGVCQTANSLASECTLRAAIEEVNRSTGARPTINFNIGGTGVQTIAPLTGLPNVTRPVVIDGTTQPGSSLNTLAVGTNAQLRIEISGASAAPSTGLFGLSLQGGNSTVRGLAINGFGGDNRIIDGAILFSGANNRIAGCFVGTDASGTLARPNGRGISLGFPNEAIASDSVVGGPAVGDRNLISGNTASSFFALGLRGVGVYISKQTSGNVVQNNLIGTDRTGIRALPNTDGLFVVGSRTTIGGGVAGEGNIIAGNTNRGLHFTSAGNNLVRFNRIGLNALGAALPNATGITFDAFCSDNLVSQNVVSGNTGDGISVAGSVLTTITGNIIGLDLAGNAAIGNGGQGINFSPGTANNTVGGTTVATRNIISGNRLNGISSRGRGNNTIQGNYIGTDISGLVARGNGRAGVLVTDNSNIIGAAVANGGNVISGNAGAGVQLSQVRGDENFNTSNTVQNNLIGLDARGTSALANGGAGVQIDDVNNNFDRARSNRIGGVGANTRNVISGNGRDGVRIEGAVNRSNVVWNNIIGLDFGASRAIPNRGSGVFFDGGAINGNNFPGNSIGLDRGGEGAGNIISGNTQDGVRVNSGAGNSVRGNQIFANGELGIDLGLQGVTPNDASDADTGPNNAQNFPVITRAAIVGSTTVIEFRLQSTNDDFLVDFYGSADDDPSGFGEGEAFLGSVQVPVRNGVASGTFRVPSTLGGRFITATATSLSTNDTSEFSLARPVQADAGGSGSCFSPPSGLVAWYKAENNARDSAGTNNGTATTDVTYPAARVGRGFRLVSGSVRVPNAPAVAPAAITAEGWVRATNPGTFKYVLGKSLSTGSASYAFYTGDSGGLFFYVKTGVAGNGGPGRGDVWLSPDATASIWDGRLHHIAGTFDGSAVRLFVDGVQVGSGAPTRGTLSYSSSFQNGDLLLGNYFFSGSSTAFPGVVDEMSLYNRALLGADIRGIFEAGSEGKCPTASASSLVVTNLNDAGGGSLRAAISTANARAGADTITFAADVTGSIDLETPLPDLTNVSIVGPGASSLSVRRGDDGAFRIFSIPVRTTVSISGLSLSNGVPPGGAASGDGGAIFNAGTLSLQNVVVSGNGSSGARFGGGIYNGGTLSLRGCTISNNSAGLGGGLYNGATAAISNSTISGNSGGAAGAIANASGRVTLQSCTITRNNAGLSSARGATASVQNSIIAGNGTADVTSAGAGASTFQSLGNNLIGGGDSAAAFRSPTDRTGITNPLLSPLQLNGGPTPTHLPLVGSLAIDRGDTTLTVDQRGVARPQGRADDIGAVEAAPVAVTPTPTPRPTASPTASPTTVPTAIPSPTPFPTDGPPLQAWGYNQFGQIGDGTTENRPLVVDALAPNGAIQVEAGGSHSLALAQGGAAFSWGYNISGQLGDGTLSSRPRAVRVLGESGTGQLSGVTQLAAGWYHSLALLRDGSVLAWGRNADGELGDGTHTMRLRPTRVRGLGSVRFIAAGVNFSAAITSDGSLWTWGRNSRGQLGHGNTSPSTEPRRVLGEDGAPLRNMVSASLGAEFALALRSDGVALSWGANGDGQLAHNTGRGGGEDLSRARAIGFIALEGSDRVAAPLWRSVAAGYVHSALLARDGRVFSCGNNFFLQLGRPGRNDNGTLRPVVSGPNSSSALSGIATIRAGAGHTVALGTDGLLRTWGWNQFGTLGDGTTANRGALGLVQGLGAVRSFSAGYGHTLALGERR